MTPESFSSHVVFEKLEQLRQILVSDNSKEKLGIDNFSFFEATYSYIKDKLNLTIPLLVQEPELAALSAEIEAGNVQINTFIGNNNIGHINNATNNFNSALNRIKNLPFPLSKDDFDFSKSIASFQQTVKGNYDKLEATNIKLQDELKATQDDLLLKQTQITNLEKSLAEKQTEIQNVLTSYNTEFETLKNNANNSVEAEKKKFNENIEADRKGYKEQIDADKESYKKIFEEQKNVLEKQSADVVSDLKTKLSEANKIVNIVGNVGVTGNYQKNANQHKGSADFFRWVALGFMVVMSGLLIYSIIELSRGDFNLYKSLVRILAAAVLTYPAVYASRESTRHRNLETQNRNLELELASIGPFIELLPEDKKQKIKEDLVNKYFGKTHYADSEKNEHDDVSVNALEKLLKTILPFVKK